MTIMCVESEWELWEEARILIKESPNKLAYKEAKKAVMIQKTDLKSLYKKEVGKHSTNTNDWSTAGIQRFEEIKKGIKVSENRHDDSSYTFIQH